MAGFKEIRFPPEISFGAVGGLYWLTRVVETEGGRERRDQVLTQPRGAWDVAHDARHPEYYELLRNFFISVRGQAFGFRFKDWTDYRVAAGDSVLVNSSGSPTQKQLAKRYTFQGESFDRQLSKIVAGTFSPVGGSGLSLDYDSGILTYSVAPSAFTCEFDVPARLGTDELRAEIIDVSSHGDYIIGWKSIPIIAVRV